MSERPPISQASPWRFVLVGAIVICSSAQLNGGDRNSLDRRLLSEIEMQFHGWYPSFQAGMHGLNGTEMIHLKSFDGKLWGSVGYWMSPVYLPGQVVRLDSSSARWQIDGIPHRYAGRIEALDVMTFSTDDTGATLPNPVSRLVGTFYYDFQNNGVCGISVRALLANTWSEATYYTEKPWRTNYFSARAVANHRDTLTGVDWFFLTAGIPGIVGGTYDPTNHYTRVKFLNTSATESGPLPTRPLSLVVVNGQLYTSGGSFILRRNDGTTPTWSKILDMAEYESGTVDESVGGIRGLTAIPAPSGVGESIYFSWCPNGQSKGCMKRVDISGGAYIVASEKCVDEMARQAMGADTGIGFVIANYNFALPVPTSGGRVVHLVGYELLLHGPSTLKHPMSFQMASTDEGLRYGYYAGAGYLIRRGPEDYEARVPGGPRFCADDIVPILISVRCSENSPFGDGTVFLGGYDCNYFPSSNTAWAMKGTAEGVHAEPVFYGD